MQVSTNSASVTAAEFSARLERMGPFESSPHLAVACSGGPDSMALLGLTHDWTRCRGGKVVALIVDHRLRPESADEAATVARTIRQFGVQAQILTREGGKIQAGLQERARAIRYMLLREYCHNFGILHLLVAHHREDQAETIRMREAKASGADGLAGMSSLLEYSDVRILRPLIERSKGSLRATAAARNLSVVEDPSNNDERFERVRVRRDVATRVLVKKLNAVANQHALMRQSREVTVAAALARACALFPEGYAWLDQKIFSIVSPEIAYSCLSVICAMIGGRAHPPRRVRTARLLKAVTGNRIAGGRTLAGCRIVPKGRYLLFYREVQNIEPAKLVANGGLWDGRFCVEMPKGSGNLQVAKLGEKGLRELRGTGIALKGRGIPNCVLVTLPAIRGVEGIRYVPHLSYSREGEAFNGKVRFAPIRPLQATRFTL